LSTLLQVTKILRSYLL